MNPYSIDTRRRGAERKESTGGSWYGSPSGNGHGDSAGAALKPYDIRYERDLGRRRHLAQATRRILRVSFLGVLDIAAIVAALGAAVFVAGGGVEQWQRLLPAVAAVQLLSLVAVDAYGSGARRNDPRRRLRGILLATLILGVQKIFYPWLDITVLQLALFAILATVGLEIERRVTHWIVGALRRRGYLWRPALVVGTAAEEREVEDFLGRLPHGDLFARGRVSADAHADPAALGSTEELQRLIHDLDARIVIICDSVPEERVSQLTARVFEAGAGVIRIPSAVRQAVYSLGADPETTMIELRPPRLDLPQLVLKRGLDVAFASLALILAAPLGLLIALAIKLDSPGPVLFSQTRVGVGGMRFRIFKFRTMIADAERMKEQLSHLNDYPDPRLFKIKEDPRVTRLGRFLRRTSLDELPQLINVIRGEMSLVGPRPSIPEEVALYGDEHMVRLSVVPGLTGPWQANGRNKIVDFEQVVRLEHDYIRNWSLWLDLKLLGRTMLAVARGEGAH